MKTASEKTTSLVENCWQAAVYNLFERDGTGVGLGKHHGHDFKNNPELRVTVEESLKEYAALFARKIELREEERRAYSAKAVDEANAALKEVDKRLVPLNDRFIEKLLQEGSGLDQELARRPDIKSREKLAIEIIGSSIKAVVDMTREGLRMSGSNDRLMTTMIPKRFTHYGKL